MKLAFVGSGYVGQVNAAGAAHYGHSVVLVDVVPEKVNMINQGKPTIYEEGLEPLLNDLVIQKKLLRATRDLAATIHDSEASFICVGTPDKEGHIDLSYIEAVARGIGEALKTQKNFHVVVVKSTVIPGTTMKVVKPILEKVSGKRAGEGFGLAMNPEFLREGVAVQDCLSPDSIVIGAEDPQSRGILDAIYAWAPSGKITHVGITAAEAIKYAKNSFLATKITFANEWANYCEQIGVDVKEVMDAIGMDKRIGPLFLRNGPGYGGSCFPKDVNAIIYQGRLSQSPFQLLEKVVEVNQAQYRRLIALAERKMGNIDKKTVAVLGLSFKPDTDDTRESPALRLIADLAARGCKINVYCPQGMKMAKEALEAQKIQIIYTKSAAECVKGAELVFVPTDWPEFREIMIKSPVPVFVGHRDLVNPKDFPQIYALGYPK